MKISFVNGICISNDAISVGLRDAIVTLAQSGRYKPKLFAYANDFAEIDCKHIGGIGEIVLDPHFQASELVFFEFGIYYPLFDLLLALPPSVASIVRFHNITPAEFIRLADRPLIERSFEQLSNVAFATHVICVSSVNHGVLRERGLGDVPNSVLPLPINTYGSPPAAKRSFVDDVVRIVFVGRIVGSKGVLDLIAAVEMAIARAPNFCLELDIIGNLRISDQDYVNLVRAAAATPRPGLTIRFLGAVSDDEKLRVMRHADLFVLPSYHEGYCVPVLEAFDAGCRVVTYDNSNLPAITGGFAALVPTGDIDALARTILDQSATVRSAEWKSAGPNGYEAYISAVRKYLAAFTYDAIGARLVAVVDSVVEMRSRSRQLDVRRPLKIDSPDFELVKSDAAPPQR